MERQGVAGWASKGFCVANHFVKAGMTRFRRGHSVVLLALFPDEIRNTKPNKNQHR